MYRNIYHISNLLYLFKNYVEIVENTFSFSIVIIGGQHKRSILTLNIINRTFTRIRIENSCNDSLRYLATE